MKSIIVHFVLDSSMLTESWNLDTPKLSHCASAFLAYWETGPWIHSGHILEIYIQDPRFHYNLKVRPPKNLKVIFITLKWRFLGFLGFLGHFLKLFWLILPQRIILILINFSKKCNFIFLTFCRMWSQLFAFLAELLFQSQQ